LVRAVTLAALLAGSSLRGEEIVRLGEVVTGMKGYGLTILDGDRIERFDVEVLGVLPNATPGRSVILVKASGLSLEKSGIVSGMSGSPVYLEGRLAGALSSGFAFSKEPIGGVTPIESMLAIDRGATPAGARASRDRSAFSGDATALPMAAAALAALTSPPEKRLEALEQALDGAMSLPVPASGPGLLALTASGFPGETLARRESLLSRLGLPVPAGASGAALGGAVPKASDLKAAPLAAGSSITALLVEGDLQLGVTGTVTRVDPDGGFLAFGHPFLGFGELELPVAPARVVTVLPSLFQSFKLGYASAPASFRLTKDRDAGVAGRSDGRAPMVPVRFRFASRGETREMNWSVAPQPRLLPALLALSADAALTTVDPTPRERTIRFRISMETATGPLAWEDLLSGSRAKELAVTTAAILAAAVAENEFEDALVSGVTIDVASESGERRLRVVEAALARRKVAPGEELAISVRLADRRGPTTSRVLKLRIPPEAPEGRAIVLVGDGNAVSAARIAAQPAEPRSLADFRRMLSRIVPNDRLGAALLVPTRGASMGGDTMSSLPPTAAVLLAEGERGEAGRIAVAVRILAESVAAVGSPVSGSVRLELEIERPRP